VSERVDLREFIGGFVVEAAELVTAANASLLEIETANADGTSRPKAVRDLFRALHTIKGLAGMVGIEAIVEIAHGLETIIRAADRAGGQLGRGAVEVALQGVRAIGERVRAVSEERTPAPAPPDLLDAIARADAAAPPEVAVKPVPAELEARLSPSERRQLSQALDTGVPVYTLSFVPSEDNAARGITIGTVRTRLAELGDIIKVAPRTLAGAAGIAFDIVLVARAPREALAEVIASSVDAVVAITLPAPPKPAPEALPPPLLGERPDRDTEMDEASPIGRAVVRVELGRLDDLQEQLSLLIVSRFRLEREIAAFAEHGHDVRRLRQVVDLQGRQLRDLRRAILRARMVRVAEVFEPLTLLIRSLSRTTGKEVKLEVDTRDAELDKAVADRLLPAMVHLVRNAVDHAIETPAERVARGKPSIGTIRVSCTEISGNQLELVIKDDGRGIDRAGIAARAKREIADDAVLLDVLCSPGFSTRDVATRTSGRGLGMDIVRRIAVSELGGELRMATELGAGTAFTLRVPLTIAIVEVFSFVCGTQSFVVPVSAIEEIFEIETTGVTTPRGEGLRSQAVLLERRGRAIPVFSLGAELAINDGAGARKALVIRRNGEPIAFSVDRMLGRQEVVVRTVDDPLVQVAGIAGATDLGDGRPTLVLDLMELGLTARERLGAKGMM
jgi:two-component system chemotaxis sensor kinase CheA